MDEGAPAPTVGGRYRLGGLLGRGGMADVYEGYDTSLARPVAVKMLRRDMAGNVELRTRFEAEARSAARLSHPNVVAIYDTGEDGGMPFIVMERLPGRTLADHLAAGPVEQTWLWRVAGDVLAALGAAHGAGLVHRDVKPGNILLTGEGCAKVADFGIAKSLEVSGADLTATGLLVGTPAYVAPERLAGQPATPRSDLYSVGVVLYEALAGRRPFDGDTPLTVAEAVRTTRPAPLAEVRPDVDPARAGAVERSMSKDPSARPASADELASSLGLRTGNGAAPTVPAPSDAEATVVAAAPPPAAGSPTRVGPGPPPAPPARSRRPMVAALVGLLAVVAFILVLAAVTGGDKDPAAVDSFDRQGLASRMEDLARRVRTGDGPRGPEAADRLEALADQVRQGGGRAEAEELLRDSAAWNGDGLLSNAAAGAIDQLLRQVPGVSAPALTTTQPTAPPTSAARTRPTRATPSSQVDGAGGGTAGQGPEGEGGGADDSEGKGNDKGNDKGKDKDEGRDGDGGGGDDAPGDG